MRNKVAKALRREAFRFAEEALKVDNIYRTVFHPKKVSIPLNALDPLTGGIRYHTIVVQREQVVCVDGPRFFYQQLKKGFMLGLVSRS